MKRRNFLRTLGLGTAAVALPKFNCSRRRQRDRPNIVYILADDLGYGELGCYGQGKIRTPNIDRLAAEGMRFTQHYSGSPVSAPSRCTLLTGKHTGNSYIRDNDEMSERGDVWHDPSLEGQRPLPHDTATIGTMLQDIGYTTACIGKWGLGGAGSTGHPNSQGFDHYYGYLCQRVAHNYYPTHLWRNSEKHLLEGNEYFSPHQRFPDGKDPSDEASYVEYSGKQYAPDLMAEEALWFLRRNRDRPFFLYYATPVPHVALQVPEDSLREYEGAFTEIPYSGNKGYLPHPTPRAAYAAMITRMDYHVGRIMQVLKELGLDDKTLVMFSSDNGPTFAGGVDYGFFESAGPLRGLKGCLYEGGIRVPMIVRWPVRIRQGTETDHVSAFWDVMPTLAEVTGCRTPRGIDGISFLPTLLGNGRQEEHEYLYWEYHGRPSQAVRMGEWKGVRLNARETPQGPIELYDLARDIGEQHDVAAGHPQIVRKIADIMAARTPSEFAKWNFTGQV